MHQQENALFALQSQIAQASGTCSDLIAHHAVGEGARIVDECDLVFATVVGRNQKLCEVELRGWG